MKKSARVTLTVVAAVGLASCSRRRDPCESSYFDAAACSDAIRGGGYYWGGSWYPMRYSYPYPYYFDRYRSYVSGGGSMHAAPAGSYARPPADSGRRFGTGGGSGSGTPSGVTRGGFGSTGAAHGSGG